MSKNNKNIEILNIPLSELKPFEDNPFKVRLDESMDELTESVQQSGVLSPIIARPNKDGGYEILSGHRRAKACEIAGMQRLKYHGSKEQTDVLKAIESEEVAPSIEQAKKLRRFSENGRLNSDVALSIMQEQKPEKIRITLKEDRLMKYFPKTFSPKQMEETIEKLLANWARKRNEPER